VLFLFFVAAQTEGKTCGKVAINDKGRDSVYGKWGAGKLPILVI
jgi:hypothetical protein